MVPYAFKSTEELVKFLNHPKVTASIMAGNVVALYYWLTNEWDRKDQLKSLREMSADGTTPYPAGALDGLSDEDIERIRDVFMEAMSGQGDGAVTGAGILPFGGGSSSKASKKKPESILDVQKKT